MGAVSSVFERFIPSAYVDPWKDARRAKTILSALCGGVGSSLVDFPISFSIAGEGLVPTFLFLFCRLAFAGIVGIALYYRMMSLTHYRLYSFLTQMTGLGLLLLGHGHLPVIIVGYTLLSLPFWGNVHMRFASQRSLANLGGESAFANLAFLVSMSSGTFLAGLLEQRGLGSYATIVGGLLLTFATTFTAVQAPVIPYTDSFNLLKKRGISARITVYMNVLSAVQDFGMPAWLRTLGMSAQFSASLLALRPILGLLIMPLVGRMVQKGSFKAVRLGGRVTILGWLLMGALVYFGGKDVGYFLLLPFAFLAVGANLITSAEVSRWYKLSSAVGVLARENAMAIGRCPTFFLSLPLTFLAPTYFPLMGIAVGFLFILGIRHTRFKDGFWDYLLFKWT